MGVRIAHPPMDPFLSATSCFVCRRLALPPFLALRGESSTIDDTPVALARKFDPELFTSILGTDRGAVYTTSIVEFEFLLRT